MTDAAFASLILFPLALLGYAALHLLRLGMTAGEMTEAARQRLAGLGILLLYLVVLLSLAACGVGLFALLRSHRLV